MGQREMFQRIQVLLHEAALEAAAWRTPSVPFDEAYGATGNSLIVVDGLSDNRKPSFVRNLHRGQRREDLERDHFQNYYSHDERTLRLQQLPHRRLVLVTNPHSAKELRTSQTFEEALSRYGTSRGLDAAWPGRTSQLSPGLWPTL